jgi:DNA-binding NtrC family response regulator
VTRPNEAQQSDNAVSMGATVTGSRVDESPQMEELSALESPAMKALLSRAQSVAASPTTFVLIQGEVGTRKESIASFIHALTPGRKAAVVRFPCVAGAEAAFEQVFATLATRQASTILLDEVGELSSHLQSRLVVALEQPQERVTVNSVRVISASSRVLQKEVREGRFRADLFHRLTAFHLPIPPLRRRREDILPLARLFLRRAAYRMQRPTPVLTADAERALVSYDFPGNVRELENVIERALIIERAPSIGLSAISLGGGYGHDEQGGPFFVANLGEDDRPPTLAEVERLYLERVLAFSSGNRSEAARLLSVSYPTITRKMAEYGLKLSSGQRTRGRPARS